MSVHLVDATPAPNDTDVMNNFYLSVRWVGWVVLLGDLIFLIYSIIFLYRLYKPKSPAHLNSLILQFIWACIVSIGLSFVYSLLFIAACVTVGGSFPMFEFFFSIIDVMLWAYFIAVVNSYSDTVVPSSRAQIPSREMV